MQKDTLKDWIALQPGGRAWLAEQLGVSLGSVNNYCAGRPIPRRVAVAVEKLMADALKKENDFRVPFTADEFMLMQVGGYDDTTDFARAAISQKARELGKSHRRHDG